MNVRLRRVFGGRLAEEAVVDQWPFVIGRAADCHLRPECPMISRHHCELVLDDQQVVLADLDSRNGTFLNGERVTTQRQLTSGDRLAIGLCLLEVMIDPLPSLSDAPEFDAHVAGETADEPFCLPADLRPCPPV